MSTWRIPFSRRSANATLALCCAWYAACACVMLVACAVCNARAWCEQEQQMVTGITDNGEKVGYKDIIEAIKPMFDAEYDCVFALVY
jgi:hypothetical protein